MKQFLTKGFLHKRGHRACGNSASTPQTSPKDFPRVGKESAFAIASTFFESPNILMNCQWLSAVLAHFKCARGPRIRENLPMVSSPLCFFNEGADT